MRLVGMAAGKTHTIEIRNSAVQTAYIKTPVSGRCYVHESGLDGNETAVHPDAVYAIEPSITKTGRRLGADRAAWLPGHFAENLTIAGLDESRLRVGDVVAVGDEVELIVAGPRIPCSSSRGAWRSRTRSSASSVSPAAAEFILESAKPAGSRPACPSASCIGSRRTQQWQTLRNWLSIARIRPNRHSDWFSRCRI